MKLTKAAKYIEKQADADRKPTEANVFIFPRIALIGANIELAGLILELLNVAIDGKEVEAEVNITDEQQEETGSQSSQSELTSKPVQVSVNPQEVSGVGGAKEKTASLAKLAAWQEASSSEAVEALADVIVKLSNLAKQIVRVVDGATEITSALGLEDDAELADRLIKILVAGLAARIKDEAVQHFLNGTSTEEPSSFYKVLDEILREYFDKAEHKKEITKAVRMILSKGTQNASYIGSMNINFLSGWFLSELRGKLRKEIHWQAPISPEAKVESRSENK
jgi:hypothetical protein